MASGRNGLGSFMLEGILSDGGLLRGSHQNCMHHLQEEQRKIAQPSKLDMHLLLDVIACCLFQGSQMLYNLCL